jgi:hypothetical protein
MYLFFVRHFNDIDHLTPVVWKMSKDIHPVVVYCMNPRYDHRGDYRLHFLKDQGVTVDYLYNNPLDRHGSKIHELLNYFVQKAYTIQRGVQSEAQAPPFYKKILGYSASRLGLFSYKLMRFGYFDMRWARSFLEKSGARAICFDHIMPSLYVVDNLLKAAKEMSIPSFTLPHGVLLYTNEATKPKSTDARRMAKFGKFDYIIVSNRQRRNLLVRSGISGKKIFVFGCARYSNEWLKENQRIVPRKIVPDKRDQRKLRVVFMPSKPQCQVNIIRLKATCDILAEMANIDIMIKPHTRVGGEKYLFNGNRLQDASHILTAELCEWADVLLVVGSSVITEALMRKKPVLYLKYLHANTTLFEELGSCWTLNDEIELKNALMSIQTKKAVIPYNQASVLKYLKEVVYGGRSDTDVLGNYQNFIVSHAKK